jgi:hypothetical protein
MFPALERPCFRNRAKAWHPQIQLWRTTKPKRVLRSAQGWGVTPCPPQPTGLGPEARTTATLDPTIVRQRRPPPAVARPPTSGATGDRETGFPLPSGLRRFGGSETRRSRQARARHRPHRWRRSQRRAGVRPQGVPRPASLRASHERPAQRQLAARFTGRSPFRSHV